MNISHIHIGHILGVFPFILKRGDSAIEEYEGFHTSQCSG
jgi:hypothetical protein